MAYYIQHNNSEESPCAIWFLNVKNIAVQKLLPTCGNFMDFLFDKIIKIVCCILGAKPDYPG